MLVSREEACEEGRDSLRQTETRGMIYIHISQSIHSLLPAGTDALEGLQSRRAFPPDEAGMEQWRLSVDSATDDFAFANRGQTTLIEHEDYMMKINARSCLVKVLQCKTVFESTATLGKWCVESPPSALSTQAFF